MSSSLSCQVATGMHTGCPVTESGGLHCEVIGPHTEHALSEHTVAHALAGNGYSCASIRGATRTGRVWR